MSDSNKKQEYRVVFEPAGREIIGRSDQTILELARNLGLYIPSDCNGVGKCGKCKVFINPVPDLTNGEMLALTASEIVQGIRLACAQYPQNDCQITLQPSVAYPKILTDRFTDTSSVDRDPNLSGQYGLAIDIGTTTIVCYLIDLETGAQLGNESALNAQIAYGEDIISRLTYALGEPKSANILQQSIVKQIDELIIKLIERHNISRDKITRATVVGNTAMHHLFLGLNIYSLSRAPYRPAMKDAHRTNAQSLGLTALEWTQFYLAPNIAGFVGGDAVSFMVAYRLDKYDGTALAIDIGTNGEVILTKYGKLYCCSTAAGPAFEGASLTNGMRAQNGAIEFISISDENEPPEISVIGNQDPAGLCGTAIIDLTYHLWKKGLVDRGGRMKTGRRIIELENKGKAYQVVRKGECDSQREILFTQGDLRQVQLAKAAIQAGSKILMKEADVSVNQLDAVILAGAFGTYIRPESALGIGLLPPVGVDNIISVGNAAGEGARRILLSSKKKRLMENLASNIKYIELAGREDFASLFTEATRLQDNL